MVRPPAAGRSVQTEIYYGISALRKNGKDVDDFRPKYFLFLP